MYTNTAICNTNWSLWISILFLYMLICSVELISQSYSFPKDYWVKELLVLRSNTCDSVWFADVKTELPSFS